MEEDKKEPSWMDKYGIPIIVIAIVIGGMLIILIEEPVTNPVSNSCTEFYSSRCPHCMNMVPVVSQVENETGIWLEKLELYENTTNQKIFLNFNESILRDCPGELGVPTFYSTKTDKAVCGEMSKEVLKQFITDNC